MKPAVPLPVLLLCIAAAGCVSRSEHEAVKKQLESCEHDKSVAQTSSSECEVRLDREAKRWDGIESQLTSTLPQTLRDFQDERAKIIRLVPEEVQKQVAGRLDRYFAGVTKHMDRMEGKVEGLREQLAASREQIAELAATTRSVDTKVDATHRAVLSEQARSGELDRQVADLVAAIADFDSQRINCEKCKDRIKLKGQGREQLLAFHSQLVKRLQRLEGARAANGTH